MKAITIWQPWSSLLAHRVKGYETRSWETSYRGPIAIHAAVVKVPTVLKKCFHEEADKMMFLNAIAKGLHGCYTTEEVLDILNNLQTGCVVATANLVGCHKISDPHGFRLMRFGDTPYIQKANGSSYTPDDVELALGDWTPGRYAWEFSEMKAITPIPAKGKQGLWEWDGGGLSV